MYARNVNERVLTFAVSGLLWETSQVMIDEETESLWSQFLGKAMQGPLQGEELEMLPSIITDWESWRTNYHNCTVALMSRTSNYNRSSRHLRDVLSINITLNGESRFWPLHPGVSNEVVGGYPLVVAFDDPSLTAVIYDRRVDGQELSFQLSQSPGAIRDDQTSSVWNLFTGEAISGPFKGKQLTMLPSMLADQVPYSTFYPRGKMGTFPSLPPAAD